MAPKTQSTAKSPELPEPEWSGEYQKLMKAGWQVYENKAEKVAIYELPDGQEIGTTGIRAVKFVDGQLIITGRPADINELISVTNAGYPGINVGLSRSTVLIPSDDRSPAETALLTFTANQLTTDQRRIDAILLAESIRGAAAERRRFVLADPNYVAGTQETPAGCGAEVIASPGSGEASPISGESRPIVLPQGVPLDQVFWDQWAFWESPGINLVDETRQRRIDLGTGENSQIIILDTSPFPKEGCWIFSGAGWATPHLEVCVEHPTTVDLTKIADCSELPYQGDHGLFVAGLAHAVAPASSIHLLRVLNDHGIGDVAGIIHTLAGLDTTLLADKHTVINLSLGFIPVPWTVPARRRQYCAQLARDETIDRCDLASIFNRADELRQRETVDFARMINEWHCIDGPLQHLSKSGVVIVAAAGNQSDKDAASPAQEPASLASDTTCHPNMYAVAASTYCRMRAFYSNAGTITAPGGGGNRPTPPDWNLPTDWVVSVAYLRDPPPNPPRRYFSYGRWGGTSFATPLVSGVVALALTTAVPPDPKAIPGLPASTDAVNRVIVGLPSTPNASLGRGIISLP